jgi:hypothetical protein
MNKEKIREMLERYTRNRMQVLEQTRLTGDQLEAMIFENGMKYLEYECQADVEGVRMMSQTGLYWKWWRNLWQQRDDKLANNHYHFNRRFYEHWHDVTAIAQHPHRYIYEYAYSQLIHEKIKQAHEKI